MYGSSVLKLLETARLLSFMLEVVSEHAEGRGSAPSVAWKVTEIHCFADSGYYIYES